MTRLPHGALVRRSGGAAAVGPARPGRPDNQLITYLEVYQGTLVSPDREQAQAKLDAFLAAVPIIPFSAEVARRCVRLRTELLQKGTRVRSRALDLLTAATALEHELTLVTRNLADYQDIPDLAPYQPR